MSRRTALVIAALLPCCVPPAQHLPSDQQAAVHAALAGWTAAALPSPDQERCDFDHVYVRVEALETGCITPVSSALHDGCLRWEASDHFFRPREYPVVVIDPTFPARYWPSLVVHELMHAFVQCSGMNVFAPGNLQHTDRRIWTRAWKDGDPGTSAESRANALLSSAGANALLALPVVE